MVDFFVFGQKRFLIASGVSLWAEYEKKHNEHAVRAILKIFVVTGLESLMCQSYIRKIYSGVVLRDSSPGLTKKSDILHPDYGTQVPSKGHF